MVPAIRKTMESLIFEVKLMLENNDASAAFWLGNLKHRNLAGEEISSQLPVISDDEQDEDVVDEIESMSENGETSYQRTKKADGKNPKKRDRKSTRLNSSHVEISYAVFCLKKKRELK